MIKKLSLLAIFCGILVATQAQKLGHINGQMLVEHMPEYKTAYEELSTYKKQYEDALVAMRAEYEKLIEDFKKSEQTAPKVILDTKVKEIQAKEQGIYDFQEQASADVSAEEQRKVEPILEKAKKAIEDVAKANGYTYIFDAGSGSMLYMGGDDITKLVCAKMGIPDFTNEAKEAPKK
ncbi:MAG: OmpH family outer membrane protein [Flavobacteriales bacterium]|jgi:outer membrane protein